MNLGILAWRQAKYSFAISDMQMIICQKFNDLHVFVSFPLLPHVFAFYERSNESQTCIFVRIIIALIGSKYVEVSETPERVSSLTFNVCEMMKWHFNGQASRAHLPLFDETVALPTNHVPRQNLIRDSYLTLIYMPRAILITGFQK